MGVWFDRGGHLFEVEEGSPEYEQLVDKLGAVRVEAPDGEPEASEDGYAALSLIALKALAAERGLDVPKSAKKTALVAALEESDSAPADDDEEGDGEPEGSELS